MILRLLSIIFGFVLILMGLWCIIFTFIMIFNLLPCFDKFPEFVKDNMIFPFNIGGRGASYVAMDWEAIKHVSNFIKIKHLAVAVFWGVMLAFGEVALIGILGRKKD